MVKKDFFNYRRELLSKEKGTVYKDWGGKLAVALVYPNYYHVGMSNLGFQLIYDLINKKKGWLAERVFLPPHNESLQEREQIVSLESGSPLRRFDIVAFSLSFENDYPNILKILSLSDIPLLSKERKEDFPIVLAGGVVTFLNPEPISDFFDLFFVGEAEDVLYLFLDYFAELKDEGLAREELLLQLAKKLNFIYVPSFYRVEYKQDGTIEKISPIQDGIHQKIHVAKRMSSNISTSCITTELTEFEDRMFIEPARGCFRGCRFCAAGFIYRPPRTYLSEDILEFIKERLNISNRLALISPAISDVPKIEDITDYILNVEGTFSISSLRADSVSEKLLINLKRAHQRTITIAPEAGSDRLRRVINKKLSNQQIADFVKMAIGIWDFSIKLYFMIGLPTETQDDIEQIPALVKKIRHHLIKASKKRGRIGTIKISINSFVPKPFTPFQWYPMEDVEKLKFKQKWLRKQLSRIGGISVSFDVPKWAYVQALLSLGDRRVGSILLLAHRLNNNWTRVFRHSEINPDFFVYREKGHDEFLPWDILEHGIRKEYLLKELILAGKERESDICKPTKCRRCGVCKYLNYSAIS